MTLHDKARMAAERAAGDDPTRIALLTDPRQWLRAHDQED